ncbi:hypothetical protein D3C83_33880 [compost metagenome]
MVASAEYAPLMTANDLVGFGVRAARAKMAAMTRPLPNPANPRAARSDMYSETKTAAPLPASRHTMPMMLTVLRLKRWSLSAIPTETTATAAYSKAAMMPASSGVRP